jgi:CCR4-NOT transcription complex subunit 3
MAQHAVDQQGTPSHSSSVPLSAVEPTSNQNQNLLYSENNNSGNVVSNVNSGGGGGGVISNNNINNNNPGVVGSGRVTAGQLGSAPSHASMPPAPTGEAHIPPLLGVAPLGPVALCKEQQVRGLFL